MRTGVDRVQRIGIGGLVRGGIDIGSAALGAQEIGLNLAVDTPRRRGEARADVHREVDVGSVGQARVGPGPGPAEAGCRVEDGTCGELACVAGLVPVALVWRVSSCVKKGVRSSRGKRKV